MKQEISHNMFPIIIKSISDNIRYHLINKIYYFNKLIFPNSINRVLIATRKDLSAVCVLKLFNNVRS